MDLAPKGCFLKNQSKFIWLVVLRPLTKGRSTLTCIWARHHRCPLNSTALFFLISKARMPLNLYL